MINNMEANNLLQYYFYVDWKFTNSKEDDLKKLDEIKKKTLNLSIEEIQKEFGAGEIPFYCNYINKFCKYVEIDIKKLKVDSRHNNLDNINDVSGMLLIDFWNKYKECSEVKKRVFTLEQDIDEVINKLPIIINEKNEVLMGNHRVLTAIKKDYEKLKVLTFCHDDDNDRCLNFNELTK